MKLLKKYHNLPVQAKATLWFMICTMLQRCVSLITTPIFTRMMSTEQYGQFTVYNSWLQIFTIITTLRLNWSVFSKGMSKYKHDRDAYTSTMQSLTFLITVGVFVVYLLFREPINRLIELPTFIIIAMLIELAMFPAVEFWTVRKRFEYIYKPVVFRTLAMAVLNGVVGVIAVSLSEEKGYARILSVIAVNFVFGLSLFIYNLRRGKRLFVKEYAVFALRFNLPLLLHYLSLYVLDQFNRIMIQKMVGVSAAAMFGVACSAGMVMKVVTQSVNNAMVPWQYEKLEKKDVKSMDETMFPVFALVAGTTVLFTMFAPEVMLILADAEYAQAVYVIPPVALGLVFSFMYTTFANVEFFFNKNKFTMYVSMAGALVNIVLNYIGITLFGYVAAAYATLICYILFAVAHYLFVTKCGREELGVPYVFAGGRLIVLSVVTVVLSLLVIMLYPYFLIRLGLLLVVTVLAVVNRKSILDLIKRIRATKKKKNKQG